MLDVRFEGGIGFGDSETTTSVTVNRALPSVAVTAAPTSLKVKKGKTTVAIDVSAAGFTPTGVVGVYVDGSLTAVAQLVNGKASVAVGPFGTVGTKVIKVAYFGDSHALAAASADVPVTVVKANKKITTAMSTTRIVMRKTTPTLTVKLAAEGQTVSGKVTVTARPARPSPSG